MNRYQRQIQFNFIWLLNVQHAHTNRLCLFHGMFSCECRIGNKKKMLWIRLFCPDNTYMKCMNVLKNRSQQMHSKKKEINENYIMIAYNECTAFYIII